MELANVNPLIVTVVLSGDIEKVNPLIMVEVVAFCTIMVVVFTLVGAMASEKTNDGTVVNETLVAPLTGVELVRVGGVVSTLVAVVNPDV